MLLVQALAANERRATPRLWLLTRRAQSVDGPDQPVAPFQAPLWGLGRVIINEQPRWGCRLLDLGARPGAPPQRDAEGDALLAELLAGDEDDEVAFRGGCRYVHRLQPASLARSWQQSPTGAAGGRRTAWRPAGRASWMT
jgi:hypothetical protein